MDRSRWTALALTPLVGVLLALTYSPSPTLDRPADVDIDSLHQDALSSSGEQPRPRVRADTFPQASAQNAAIDSALKAAEVDPGILIFPDSSVEAQIQTITPLRSVDPEMVVPPTDDREKQGDGE